MKFALTRRRKWMLAGGALIFATATPSFALFGIGDIVFDPTSYAQLFSQLTTLTQQYTMLKNNLEHFSLKTQWQTTLNQMEHVNVANMFGETNGMSSALNTNSPTAASMAWTSVTVPVNGSASTYLSTQPANSAQKSQLAMIEASDAASPDCLNAVGAYRAARDASTTAASNLQSQQLDSSDGTNTEIEQLNLLNASQAQHLAELQAQGVIHACLAQQMAIQNMQQRNAAAEDLNTWGTVQDQHNTNPSFNVTSSSTWTTYVP